MISILKYSMEGGDFDVNFIKEVDASKIIMRYIPSK